MYISRVCQALRNTVRDIIQNIFDTPFFNLHFFTANAKGDVCEYDTIDFLRRRKRNVYGGMVIGILGI